MTHVAVGVDQEVQQVCAHIAAAALAPGQKPSPPNGPPFADFSLGRILDVLLLLPADHATLEERVHEIYEWRVDYAKDAAKSTVATSVSFAAAVIVSLFKTELHVAWYWITLGLCAAVAIATFGVVAYVRVARLHSEYAAAIAIVRSVARP